MKVVKGLLATSAIAAVLALQPTGARAQGQSELEALRAQIQALQKKVEALETKAAAPAATAPAAPPAGAAPTVNLTPESVVLSSNTKIRFTFGGWVNRALIIADDGFDTDFLNTDNSGATTRLFGTASGKFADGWTGGLGWELEAVSNQSRVTAQSDIAGASNSTFSFNERKLEVWFEGPMGRFWVGQGDLATQAVAEADLSGTTYLGLYTDVGATFGGLRFRTSEADTVGVPVNTAFTSMDGPTLSARDDRVRYDTPTFGGGFQASASVVNDGAWDAALRYTGKFGDTAVAAALGYANGDDLRAFAVGDAFSDQVSGSFSVRVKSGLNATFAAGIREIDAGAGGARGARDSEFYYVKLGYLAKLSTLGNTALAIDYYSQEDHNRIGDEATAYGVTAVQTLDAINSEIYFAVRNHELDRIGASYDDVLGIMTGARVKF